MGLNVKLYDYQEKAKREVTEHWVDTIEALNHPQFSKFVSGEDRVKLLWAPTGSGKTVIVSGAVVDGYNELTERGRRVVFFVLAPNSLHRQFSEALVDNGVENDGRLKVVGIDEVRQDHLIQEGDVIVSNYASVDKKENIVIEGKESGTDLQTQFDELREEGVNVILIVDEAHINYAGARAQEFISEVLQPDATLLVTATPPDSTVKYRFKESGEVSDQTIIVDRDDVINQGVIVKSVIINEGIDEVIEKRAENDLEVDLLFVKMAAEKASELERLYNAEKADVTPLIGVQIPSKSRDVFSVSDGYREKLRDDKKTVERRDAVEKFFEEKYGWSVESGEVAVWLAEEKTDNLADEIILPNDSSVRAIIFKEAIAVGWDCPRLKTMALLRDNKTRPFNQQTVGRAVRQPELKTYLDERLNHAYVYTGHAGVEKLLTKPGIEPEKEKVNFKDTETVQRLREEIRERGGLKNYDYVRNDKAYIPRKTIVEAGNTVLKNHGIDMSQVDKMSLSVKDWEEKFGLDVSADAGSIGVLGTQEIDVDSESDLTLITSRIKVAQRDAEKIYEAALSDACRDGSLSPNPSTARYLRRFVINVLIPRTMIETDFIFAITGTEDSLFRFQLLVNDIMREAFDSAGDEGKSTLIKESAKPWLPTEPIWVSKKVLNRDEGSPAVKYSMYEGIDMDMPTTEAEYVNEVVKKIADSIREDYKNMIKFSYLKNGVSSPHLAVKYDDGVHRLTYPDYVNFFYADDVLTAFIVEVKSEGSKRGDSIEVIRKKAKALSEFAKSNSKEGFRVFAEVWSFGEDSVQVLGSTPEEDGERLTQSEMVERMLEME